MKYMTLILVISSSVLAAPIEKLENEKREKKSPQMSLLSGLTPMSPFDPLASLGLSDLQLRKAQENQADEHQPRAGNYGPSYYSGASGGGGAVGVFPNAQTSVAAIPLLLSCSPSVVSGHLSSSKPLYKSHSEMRTWNSDEPTPKIQRSANQKDLEDPKLFHDKNQDKDLVKLHKPENLKEKPIHEIQLENIKLKSQEPSENTESQTKHSKMRTSSSDEPTPKIQRSANQKDLEDSKLFHDKNQDKDLVKLHKPENLKEKPIHEIQLENKKLKSEESSENIESQTKHSEMRTSSSDEPTPKIQRSANQKDLEDSKLFHDKNQDKDLVKLHKPENLKEKTTHETQPENMKLESGDPSKNIKHQVTKLRLKVKKE